MTFYCLVVWAIVQAYGNDGVLRAAATDPANMFFFAIERYVGPWASDAMYVLIVTSVIASQIAFYNAITRYSFNLARDGLLPARLAHTHPRFGSPVAAGNAQTVLAAVVVGAFAITGADPYIDLLLKVNSPASSASSFAGDHLGGGRGVFPAPPPHHPGARRDGVRGRRRCVALGRSLFAGHSHRPAHQRHRTDQRHPGAASCPRRSSPVSSERWSSGSDVRTSTRPSAEFIRRTATSPRTRAQRRRMLDAAAHR